MADSLVALIRQRSNRLLLKSRQAAGEEAADALSELGKRHGRVVAEWEHKPRFVVRIVRDGESFRYILRVAGKHKRIYRFVDRGTDGPYIIRAKRGRYLHFQGGHSAKTAPGGKYNVGNGGRTGNWAKKEQVTHPGIPARGFSKTFNKTFAPELRQRIIDVIRPIVSRGG